MLNPDTCPLVLFNVAAVNHIITWHRHAPAVLYTTQMLTDILHCTILQKFTILVSCESYIELVCKKKCRCRIYFPSATKTSSNCSASVTLVHLMRMRAGSVFSGSWWNLQGRVMEPPRCVTTLPGAVCTITAPESSSERTKEENNLSFIYLHHMCHTQGPHAHPTTHTQKQKISCCFYLP